MRRYSLLLILAGLVVSVSCQTVPRSARVDSTPPPESPAAREKLISYPFDAVWSALEEVLKARGWIITSRDQDTGVITTSYEEIAGDSAYAHCRSGRRSSLREYRAQLDITVKRVTANGTNVTIVSRFDAVDSSRRESQPRVECGSTGQLETELFAAVDSVILARK